jgi:hypothetical protein
MGLPWATAGMTAGVASDEVIVRKGNGAVAPSGVSDLRSRRRAPRARAPIGRTVVANQVRKMEVM